MKSAQSSKRGRKPIPPKWSRLIDMQQLDGDGHEGYVIDDDIDQLVDVESPVPKRGQKQW